jgi:ActR/RegA family two-component response regulator
MAPEEWNVSAAIQDHQTATVVLNIGVDQAYLDRRHAILVQAGFQVIDAASAREAVTHARGRDVRIAIFGHRLGLSERLKIADELKRSMPGIRIVVMYDQSVSKTEHADAVLQINVPPADLVHTMQYLLSSEASSKGRPL